MKIDYNSESNEFKVGDKIKFHGYSSLGDYGNELFSYKISNVLDEKIEFIVNIDSKDCTAKIHFKQAKLVSRPAPKPKKVTLYNHLCAYKHWREPQECWTEWNAEDIAEYKNKVVLKTLDVIEVDDWREGAE